MNIDHEVNDLKARIKGILDGLEEIIFEKIDNDPVKFLSFMHGMVLKKFDTTSERNVIALIGGISELLAQNLQQLDKDEIRS